MRREDLQLEGIGLLDLRFSLALRCAPPSAAASCAAWVVWVLQLVKPQRQPEGLILMQLRLLVLATENKFPAQSRVYLHYVTLLCVRVRVCVSVRVRVLEVASLG